MTDDTNSKPGILNEIYDAKQPSESPSPTTLTKYSLEDSPQIISQYSDKTDKAPVSPLASDKFNPTNISRKATSPSDSPPTGKAKSRSKEKLSSKRRRSKSSSSSPVRKQQRSKSPKYSQKSHSKSPKYKRSKSPNKKKPKVDESSFSPYSVKSRSPKRSKKKSRSRSPKEKHKSSKH